MKASFLPRHRFRTTAGLLGALSIVVAACGSSNEQPGGAQDADGVIRMVLAPDPVWDWLTDTGIRQKMEEKAGMKILSSSTWDEFGVYAGGHADVVSAASYEVPLLEKATDVPTTIIGKYNSDRGILAVRSDSDYQNICDLKGKRIASLSAVSVTIIWGVYAKKFCNLDLRAKGGDYELVITDITQLSSVLARGDVEACICIPEFATAELRSGKIRTLYNGRSAAQLFADKFGQGAGAGVHPATNVFLAPQAWVEKNPEEAAFLLSVWERGLREWREHQDEIIEKYPQHFAAEGPRDIKFIKNWLDNRFNWFYDSVYMDQQWIADEKKVLRLMKETNYLKTDKKLNFTTLEPPQS